MEKKSQLENVIVVIPTKACLMVGTDHISFILLTYMSLFEISYQQLTVLV